MRIKVFGLVAMLAVTLAVGWSPAAAQDESVPLTETVTSSNGTLTLNHPLGWVVDTSIPSGILLATSQLMLDADQGAETLPPGEVQLLVVEGVILDLIVPGWEDAQTIDETFDLVSAQAVDEGNRLVDSEMITLAGFPARVATNIQADREGLIGVINFEGHFVLVGANSTLGEYADHAGQVLAVFDTLRHNASDPVQLDTLAALSESYTSDNGVVSFDHPVGWAVDDLMPGLLLVASDPATIDSVEVEGDFFVGGERIGEAFALIVDPTLTRYMFTGMAGAQTLDEAYEGLWFDFPLSDPARFSPDEPSESTIAGHRALIAGNPSVFYVGLIDFDGSYVLVMSWTGTDATNAALLLAVFDTMQVNFDPSSRAADRTVHVADGIAHY